MESALYVGRVRHTRLATPRHGFGQRLFMVYLDLAELDRVFAGRWLWGVERARFASFRRADHLGDPRVPLDVAVRDLVAAQTGRRPRGPIRLLTQLRSAGYVFNPLSLHYCFDAAGALEAVVADVSNTPWNERHAYVLPAAGGRVDARVAKRFYVSPYLPMTHEYRFRLEPPGERLRVRIENEAGGARQFDAQLELARREITGGSLARTLLRFPAMSAQGIAAIYWQAFRLRRLGAPEYPHPSEAKRPEALA
jgi:hypothetical protein